MTDRGRWTVDRFGRADLHRAFLGGKESRRMQLSSLIVWRKCLGDF